MNLEATTETILQAKQTLCGLKAGCRQVRLQAGWLVGSMELVGLRKLVSSRQLYTAREDDISFANLKSDQAGLVIVDLECPVRIHLT